jgi:methyl-accepting chemotaxis protein
MATLDSAGGNKTRAAEMLGISSEDAAQQAQSLQGRGFEEARKCACPSKQKQVLGVTLMVALIVIALSLLHLINTAGVLLAESRDRFELFGSSVYSQAAARSPRRRPPTTTCARSSYVQSALQSALYSQTSSTRSSSIDQTVIIASSDPEQVGKTVPRRPQLNDSSRSTPPRCAPSTRPSQPRVDAADGARRHAVRRDPHRPDDGLVPRLNQIAVPAVLAAGIALLIAVATSMLLAQVVLRPMHVIRSSLSRLGRGDLGATLDLRDDEEFRELGDVFDQVSAQLRAARAEGLQPRSSPSCRGASRWSGR